MKPNEITYKPYVNNTIFYKGFRIHFCTNSKDEQEVIFIKSKCFIKPNIEKTKYDDEIDLLINNFRQYVSNVIHNSEIFQNRHLCSLDISKKCIVYNKFTKMKFDVFVKLNELYKNNLTDDMLKDLSTNICEWIIDKISQINFSLLCKV